jgi:hypothetical protein
MEAKPENNNKEVYRVGMAVFILLVFLTIGEYAIGATAPTWIAPLFVVAIIKAFFIIRDYMHFPRLFAGDEEEQS